MKINVTLATILVPLYEKGLQFQYVHASVLGGALTTNAHMHCMRGLGQMTYMGDKAGGFVKPENQKSRYCSKCD